MNPRTTPLSELLPAAARGGGGEVFAGIPALARVSPSLATLAVCSVDGTLDSTGDDRVAVTLQSVSKPFAWAIALERFGIEAVLERVGVEPSGDRFDSVIRLEAGTGRPFNPMVNAGALAVASLFVEADGALAPARLLEAFSRWAGRPLEVDLEVALSERETSSHRNRAIAWLLTHHGIVRAEVEAVLELYFQQCALLADVGDLARMAATLAGGGRHPTSGEQVITRGLVPRVLAVMTTCGFYDDSGRFAFEVGLPAKSGISGAVIAVAPGIAGLAAIAPPLDPGGHSVTGRRAIAALAHDRGLNTFGTRPSPSRAPNQEGLASALDAAATRLLEGRVAPALAHLLPDSGLAIAFAPCGGEILIAGAPPASVSLQATANPFTWWLVASALGVDVVSARAGFEPSGNAYHAIELDTRTRRPFNPLGNAGAIATAGLVPGRSSAERLAWVTSRLGRLVGLQTPLRVDTAVLAAEHAASARNRAIASLLRAVGAIEDEAAALELYLQLCSVRLDLGQLARLAASLAGDIPRPAQDLVDPALAPPLLALLATCGLHDESGRAAWELGVPMKSGISGVLVAVVPGVCGLAAWSPRVNDHGTPVAARAVVHELVLRYGWNVFGA